MSKVLALVGNPNSGKTTLFNELTGTAQYVGNWPGVTVEKKEGVLRGHKNVKIMDLPGIYSLSPYTLEEVIARDYLIETKVDAVINLVDGSNIERNLYLTTQIVEMGVPVVLALNMMDLVKKDQDKIDIAALSKKLGCPVVPITAVTGEGVDKLIEVALKTAEAGTLPQPISFSQGLGETLEGLENLVSLSVPPEYQRWTAIKLFERDEKALSKIELSPKIVNQAEDIIQKYEEQEDDDSESILTGERYAEIQKILAQCYTRHTRSNNLTTSDRIDRIVTSRILGLPIFIAIMFFVYWIATFVNGPGTAITDWTNDVFVGEWIQGGMETLLTGWGASEWIISLVVDGIFAGVGAVIGFLPQMAILFLCLSFLEQIGYMARIAFLMDRLFRKFGLSGKSFVPILISTGCAVPGIMSTRTIENDKDRKMTIILTSFIPCGAKLPVIAMIAGSMFGGSWWFGPMIYFACIGVIVISGIILKKTRFFAGEPAPFVMELPPYHWPRLKSLAMQIWERLRAFITKAGTIILLSSIVIWVLSSLNWSLALVDPEESILASLGRVLEPIFRPLGFGRWQAIVGTVSGLVAKENLISSMAILYPDLAEIADEVVEASEPLWPHLQSMFTQIGAFSFLIFNMICAPCFAAIGATRREMGNEKWTWIAIIYQTGLAYVLSLLIYQLGSFFTGHMSFGLGTAISFMILATILYLLLRPDHYKKPAKAQLIGNQA